MMSAKSSGVIPSARPLGIRETSLLCFSSTSSAAREMMFPFASTSSRCLRCIALDDSLNDLSICRRDYVHFVAGKKAVAGLEDRADEFFRGYLVPTPRRSGPARIFPFPPTAWHLMHPIPLGSSKSSFPRAALPLFLRACSA